MVFRIATHNIFLTYAQCPLDKADVCSHLAELLADNDPHIRVSHELHDDGGHHLHCYIHCRSKLTKQGNNAERYFDIIRDDSTYHPNIETRIRDQAATFAYVSKENDFIDFGQPEEYVNRKRSRSSIYALALSAETRQDFMDEIRNGDPMNYVLQHERLLFFADKRYKPVVPEFQPYDSDSFDITRYPDLQLFSDSVEVWLWARCPPRPRKRGSCLGHKTNILSLLQDPLVSELRVSSLLASRELARLSGLDLLADIATGTATSTSGPSTPNASTLSSTTLSILRSGPEKRSTM